MPNLKRFPVHSLPRQVSFAILKIMRRVLLILTAILVLAAASRADTLHLKDGSTVTGIIVGFDQNSFRVKTSYGFAVVRRDAVVSIDVAEGNSGDEKRPAAEKKPPAPAATPHVEKPASTTPAPAPGQPAVKPATSSPPAQPTNAAAISPKPVDKTAHSEPAATSSNAPKTAPPPTPSPNAPTAETATANPAPGAAKPAVIAPKPAPPAKPADEPIREEASGNSYSNLTYGFRMYKPPTWEIVKDARKTLPGTIAALGTEDENTYLLIGTSPAPGSLDADLKSSDVKLREMFDNYRPLGDDHLTISGISAIERKFRGSIDTHEWSGVVVLLERGKQTYTILGMTVANSDLVQIQENVIRRAISSLQFNP
jgi:outer membrane biosynthesis protein TonB